MIYTRITPEQVSMLMRVFARLTEKGWEIPAWLVDLDWRSIDTWCWGTSDAERGDFYSGPSADRG